MSDTEQDQINSVSEENLTDDNVSTTSMEVEEPVESEYEDKTGDVSEDLPIYQRVLLSLDECGRIFGPQGQWLRKVKTDNDVKINITEKQAGCSDRILTIAGSIKNISTAIKDIIRLLIENKSAEEEEKRYPFYFLNSFLSAPKLSDFKDVKDINEIYNSRLILTNSQISSIIGKHGNTIKFLASNFNVRLVASKNFLPDSDERILQIQGTSNSIGETVLKINKIIHTEINISQITEKHYFPHVLNRNSGSSNNSNNTTNGGARKFEKEFSATVVIPEGLVGAMMGSKGNRISNLRKFTHTRIDTGKSDNLNDTTTNEDGEKFRKFIIIGDNLENVKKAESLLAKNLEAEIQKHKEAEENLAF